jgi:hypothetical protein
VVAKQLRDSTATNTEVFNEYEYTITSSNVQPPLSAPQTSRWPIA